MDHVRPCPFCQSGRFVAVPGAKIELSLHGANTRTTDLRGAAMVCAQCGHVSFFVAQPEAWLAAMLDEKHRANLTAPYPSLVTAPSE